MIILIMIRKQTIKIKLNNSTGYLETFQFKVFHTWPKLTSSRKNRETISIVFFAKKTIKTKVKEINFRHHENRAKLENRTLRFP